MNSRYLEIDSTYRNRNQYPLASNFIIPISQSGNKGYREALDPVSLEMPIFAWTSNYLNIINDNPSQSITGVFDEPNFIDIKYESDLTTFVISTTGKFQKLKNYYSGLVISNTSKNLPIIPRRRIINSKYLGSYMKPDSNTDTSIEMDMTQITISGQFLESITLTKWIIEDPSYIASLKGNLSFLYIPSGGLQENTYINFLIYNETQKNFAKIISYDAITHIISFDVPESYIWKKEDNYCLRIETPHLYPYTKILPVSSLNTIITDGEGLSPEFGYYKDYFLRILPKKYKFDKLQKSKEDNKTYNNQSRKINQYIGDVTKDGVDKFYSTQYTFIVDTPFAEDINLHHDTIEILKFSYDNYHPFIYTGSTVSQQEMVCYKLELLDIILPNEILSIGTGGRIAYYPYVYVEISNVSAPGGGLKNIIYSNNPNATKAIYRVPIYDIVNPSNSAFVKVDGDGMVQTIKFKPNDNLQFSVTLPNGEYYKTISEEYFSPSMPNLYSQISACFCMERL